MSDDNTRRISFRLLEFYTICHLPESRLVDGFCRVQRRQRLDTQIDFVQHRFGFFGQGHTVFIRVRVFLLTTAADNCQSSVSY